MKPLFFLSAAALLLYFFVYAGAPEQLPEYRLTGSVMGTQYEVKLVDVELDRDTSESLSVEIQSRLDRVDNLMSTYKPTSEVNRFNLLAPNQWMNLSQETVHVLSLASEISQASSGRYDFTVSPLIDLWGFGVDKRLSPELPDQAEIDAAKAWVGYESVVIDLEENKALKEEQRLINLSSIAKGYAVDLVDQYLVESGYLNFLIEVGGEIVTRGHNARAQPWNLGIEIPDHQGRAAYKTLSIDGKALATSGDYRNFWADQGYRYSHLIDPISGRPTTHQLASVSVIADTAAMADGWATALFIMGPEQGVQFAEERDIEALFIVRKDEGFYDKATSGFSSRLNEVK